MAARRSQASDLLTASWLVDGLGPVSLVVPSRPRLEQVDAAWPPLRLPTDVHHHWRWVAIAKRAKECFGLVGSAGELVSIWSTAKTVVRLEGRKLYRLDYLEVCPPLRGTLAGAFTLAVAATRAGELGCEGLVLAAFPVVSGFYAKFGGVQRAVKGWKVAEGLLPFYFDSAALTQFGEVTDAARQEDDE